MSEDGLVTVKAQMSGVFYRAGAADQPPFVETGTTVRKGQTLALLESMKVFSKIKAPIEGIVVDISAANEDTVSVGQVLFRLRRG